MPRNPFLDQVSINEFTSTSYYLQDKLNNISGGGGGSSISASYAETASLPIRGLITASISEYTITFTKGDDSTFPIPITNTLTASIAESVPNYETGWEIYASRWSASFSAPDIGNGTLEGYYKQIGKTTFVRINLYTSSSTTFGSGSWYFDLPTNAITPEAIVLPSTVIYNRGDLYQATSIINNGTNNQISVIVNNSGSNISTEINSNFPFRWGDDITGHKIQINGTYESA